MQRRKTNGGVLGAGSVIKKCNSPDCRIVVGSGVLRERGNTHGCVVAAGSIFRKRASACGRIRVAVGVAK
jgi:hypothetical protein